MFRTSMVHLQERSYVVCCNLVRPVVMRVKEELQSSSSFTLITYRDIPNCNIQHKNAPENGPLKSETWSYWMLWIKLIIKYCVTRWITDILHFMCLNCLCVATVFDIIIEGVNAQVLVTLFVRVVIRTVNHQQVPSSYVWLVIWPC